MSIDPQSSGAGSDTASMVEDLFLTDAFLIKGRLAGKYQRLNRMLEDYSRNFLTIEDATMISLRSNDVVRAPRLQVNTKELILAHELVDMAGDAALKHLAADDKSVRIRAFYGGAIQIEIAGRISPQAYESSQGSDRKYFVMCEPMIRGMNLEAPNELRLLKGLSYAIVQKSKLSYVYDFS